jgi:hypothetical protein
VQELRLCDLYNLSLGYSLRPVLLLDIRSASDFENGHCFGAASVSINALAIDSALEEGMSDPDSSNKELFSSVLAQLQQHAALVSGTFDSVFNRKSVHHQHFLNREHAIVCVYGCGPSAAALAYKCDAAKVPMEQRVAFAIAAQSSSEFTCFYFPDGFDSFAREYPFAVLDVVDNDSAPKPLAPISAVNGHASDADDADAAACSSPPAAAELDSSSSSQM